VILSELTKRVAVHMKKQQERMVQKANAQVLQFEPQETSTLLIPKLMRLGAKLARIPVQVLERCEKVCENPTNLKIYSL
jgi:hypothetical protein